METTLASLYSVIVENVGLSPAVDLRECRTEFGRGSEGMSD